MVQGVPTVKCRYCTKKRVSRHPQINLKKTLVGYSADTLKRNAGKRYVTPGYLTRYYIFRLE